MADIPELVRYIAEALTDQPEAIAVSETRDGRTATVHLEVAPDDMGRIIGREGRVANAIRSVLKAAADDEARWRLEIVD